MKCCGIHRVSEYSILRGFRGADSCYMISKIYNKLIKPAVLMMGLTLRLKNNSTVIEIHLWQKIL